MPETPKQKDKPAEPAEKDRSSWSEDQQKRGYYYDDAHGYEKYEPEKDEEDDQSDD
ncbi:MAG: hypothetical protein IPI64_11545 [Chloracidobacterium sp.]|nr:hypothetical protein [Chloracidobacterium sp.]